ncbi:hypothetical protein LY78DRAFT_682984 [Colletotrichum sublineola]|nr:hypothetical protein LY78DRAFT_682984 [Colletotrichum sublineola]
MISLETSDKIKKGFGAGIGRWTAFPDNVAALKRLKKHSKLMILSNDTGSYKPNPRNFAHLVQASR